MTPERLARIRAVLDKRQPDLTVLLERVHKPHNLSAILRSCDAVGVLEAHAIPPAQGELSLQGRTYNETSGSAAKWVGLRLHDDTASAFAFLRRQGFQILAAHFSQQAVDYRQVDYTRPTCILLGTEKWGVSPEAAQQADQHVIIPMMGMVQSLNVSVAAAVILFEAQRQRLEAGFYDRPRLTPARYQEVLQYWLKRHEQGEG